MLKSWSLAAVLAAGLLAGCTGVSSDEAPVLSLYLENAAEYYDGGDFARAYQQWGKALELDSANEKARLGQTYALYQLGRVNAVEAINGPLTEATERVDKQRTEDFDKDQWKVELVAALIHERWCDLYDRKIRKIGFDVEKGVPADTKQLEIAKSELARHLQLSEQAFKNVLAGSEREPRDRLTCWLGLATIAAWKEDLDASLKYAQLYVDQAIRSKKLWKDSAERYPKEAPIFDAKFKGAEMQEADLRELMGAVLVRQGRLDEAETQIEMVVKMFPRRASAYFNRGVLLEARNEDDRARADFKKFLAYTDLPETDPMILEATKHLTEAETRLARQEKLEDEDKAPPPMNR
jgi:Tfp pilus assembly protein PilF